MTAAPPELSILVVSYRTREMTLECLRSLFRETSSPSFEVLVVDNASDDGSADAIATAFPDVQLIASRENLGFARANNLAADHARGRRLLLLNPDTVVLDSAITRLHAFAEAHPGARLWGGRTLFADGSLNARSCAGRQSVWSILCLASGLAHLFPRSSWLNPEGLGPWRRDSVREVDLVSGCFLLIDRDLWDELGGFDREFFMYGEDTDLCLRARARGARALIDPQATIVHYGGASEPVLADKVVRLFRAKVQLMRRHWPAWQVPMGVGLLQLHVLIRRAGFGVQALFRPSARSAAQQWRNVWQRRREWRSPTH